MINGRAKVVGLHPQHLKKKQDLRRPVHTQPPSPFPWFELGMAVGLLAAIAMGALVSMPSNLRHG
jgi:hypothetical protein